MTSKKSGNRPVPPRRWKEVKSLAILGGFAYTGLYRYVKGYRGRILMPCTDSSSNMVIIVDADERLCHFEFTKITCGQPIRGQRSILAYCRGKKLEDIFQFQFYEIVPELPALDEETAFLLYLEWDALRCAIAQFTGKGGEDVDYERSRILSVETTEKGTQISQIIFPPKEMPKIIPCCRRP